MFVNFCGQSSQRTDMGYCSATTSVASRVSAAATTATAAAVAGGVGSAAVAESCCVSTGTVGPSTTTQVTVRAAAKGPTATVTSGRTATSVTAARAPASLDARTAEDSAYCDRKKSRNI